jgi:hypothetical protein
MPAVVFFFSALWVPESPLAIKNGRRNRPSTHWRGLAGRPTPPKRFARLRAASLPRTRRAPADRSVGAVHQKVLTIGVLAVLQRWSGINVIFNYAEEFTGARDMA